MAQLGDTTVIGNVHATGRVSGEANKIKVDNWNTFDPRKLPLQIGEIMTVYDSAYGSVSNSPFSGHTSSGIIMKTNTATNFNASYRLILFESSHECNTVMRHYVSNVWGDWVTLGGASGLSSQETSLTAELDTTLT